MDFYLMITLVGIACCLWLLALLYCVNRYAAPHTPTQCRLPRLKPVLRRQPRARAVITGGRNQTPDQNYPQAASGAEADAIDGSVRALCQVIRMRDPYTADHQIRVADLAHAIAAEMGLSEW